MYSVHHTLRTNDAKKGNKGLSFMKGACSKSEMAQGINVVPRTHVVERENQLLQVVF